jgi:dTDP-4-amino-4,6-dideoxygalactose transaminase
VSEVAGGRNSRLDELQAAILRAKLPLLDSWNARRRAVARRYDAAFGADRSRGFEDVAHLYVIRRKNRDILRRRLAEAGLASDIHYPIPDYRQPSLRMDVQLRVTEALCEEVLTLPLFPEITDEEAEAVIEITVETRPDQGES